MLIMRLLGILLITCLASLVAAYRETKYSLLMPNVRPDRAEQYLCTPIKVDSKKSYFITGFEPNATMATAHHMLIYGCTTPGAKTRTWNCGEMVEERSGEKYASPCAEGSQIIYAWAMDAPKLNLPEGVGFRVGGDSPIQYLVLQVHYLTIDPFKDGKTDDSGVFLRYTERPLKKMAGVILLGTGGAIRPQGKEQMEVSCSIKEKKTIHPFAFRTHTHKLGKSVSGYRVRQNEAGVDEWTLLGRRDPQLPQMFYPTFTNETIGHGDILAARCDMESRRSTVTLIGSTNKDEMCNFYLMYYVDNGEPLKNKYCFSAGPPYYYWRFSDELNNLPATVY